jgi:long-chain acyl-CoA synthetase
MSVNRPWSSQLSRISNSFFRNARDTPEKLAIWCEGSSLSYGELASLVSRWTNHFAARGGQRGDHIGVLLQNSVEFVALMIVAADLGMVLVPLNTTLPVQAIHHGFQVSDVKHVVATSDSLKSLQSSQSHDFSFANGLWLSVDEGAPGFESLKSLLEPSPPDSGPMLWGRDEDPFILTMTSGSTGDPKPIVLTQRTKFNRASAAAEMYGVTPSDRTLAATPLYHSLAERLVLLPLLTGGTSILMSRYSPSEWLRCVSEQAVSFTIAVSSQLRQITKQLSSTNGPSISSLRCVVSSSAQLEPQVKADLLSKLHCQFHECYGTSEIAIASDLDGVSEQTKIRSVGKAAPGVEIEILSEDGAVASAGEIGEIICKTPMIFGGYFKRPDLTAAAMWGEYFRTGDLGTLDEDGYLYYLGRLKEIIITGGINVYPKDIESVLSEHPLVLENAVFPLPDYNLGEIVAVAIVPGNPDDFDLRKIRFHCAERLADFQQPRKYFLMKALPKNEMGKVIKHTLAASCIAQENSSQQV